MVTYVFSSAKSFTSFANKDNNNNFILPQSLNERLQFEIKCILTVWACLTVSCTFTGMSFFRDKSTYAAQTALYLANFVLVKTTYDIKGTIV